MSLSLRFETRLEMIQSLVLFGGATQSIFPQAEALLGSSDYQEAVEFVARRKNMHRYQSVMDFLFCELHPEWAMACQRYYNGDGAQLRELITPEDLVVYNERLLIALEVAHDLLKENRCKSWRWFRQKYQEAVEEAA